jgi:hypothetical protein
MLAYRRRISGEKGGTYASMARWHSSKTGGSFEQSFFGHNCKSTIIIINIFFKIIITGATIISERSREKSSLGLINGLDACSFSTFAVAHRNTA